jgi:Mn-dependent DtxR family transcriptional regulator
MLMFIIEQKNYPSQSEISKHIGISPASVSWQIKRLQDYGIIDEIKEGKFKRYKLHGDSKQVVALLKNYYPSIWNRWSNRLAELFLSLSKGEEEQP